MRGVNSSSRSTQSQYAVPKKRVAALFFNSSTIINLWPRAWETDEKLIGSQLRSYCGWEFFGRSRFLVNRTKEETKIIELLYEIRITNLCKSNFSISSSWRLSVWHSESLVSNGFPFLGVLSIAVKALPRRLVAIRPFTERCSVWRTLEKLEFFDSA